jgi:hypothetical protein
MLDIYMVINKIRYTRNWTIVEQLIEACDRVQSRKTDRFVAKTSRFVYTLTHMSYLTMVTYHVTCTLAFVQSAKCVIRAPTL